MAENPEDPPPALNGDMIYQILLRLPTTAIHRCRVVCREWRALTTDRSFITAHRERHPPMPLFFYRRDIGNGFARVELQAIDLAARESLPVVRFDDVSNTTVREESRDDLGGLPDPMAGEGDLDALPDPMMGEDYLDYSSDLTEGEDDLDHSSDLTEGEDDLDDIPDPMAVEEELDLIPDPVAGEDDLENAPVLMPGEEERDSLFMVHGSCDGILLLSYVDILYVCNPITRHWDHLPAIHAQSGIIGFYACGPRSGEGKVLYRILYQIGYGRMQSSYWIRILRPPGMETVHKIGRRISPGMPPELDGVLLAGIRPAYEEPPTMVKGNLHWLPQDYALVEINMIMVFDTAVEQFRWIRPPLLPDQRGGDGSRDIPDAGAFQVQLLETQGMLAMAIIDDARTVIDIWVLHDYDYEQWGIRHQIHMPGAAITASIDYDETRYPPVYIVSLNQDLMVLVPSPRTLLQCDANGVVLKHHRRSQDWTICTPHVYQESFVVHDFLTGVSNNYGKPLLLSPDAFPEQQDE